jgi:hypothetical protein
MNEAVRLSRPLGRLVLYLMPLFVLVVGGFLVKAALDVDPRGCQDPQEQYLPDRALLLVAAAALVIGRYLGSLRYDPAWGHHEQSRAVKLIGGLAVVALFAAVTAVLVYEAVGVNLATSFGISSPEPITYYVRCAIVDDKTGNTHGWLTFSAIVLVSGLVGHWLWALTPAHSEDHS